MRCRVTICVAPCNIATTAGLADLQKSFTPAGGTLFCRYILAPWVGCFWPHFLAATILPAQSEAGLAALILAAPSSVTLLVITASLGNILGAVVNWYLGRGLTGFAGKWWFPANSGQLARTTGWYDKYGRWSLLLSWVPIIGDPLTVVAGIMREPLPRFLLIVGIAKTARYVVVAVLALQWL